MNNENIVLEVMDSLIPYEKLPNGFKDIVTKFHYFRKELVKESDRGCALLAASYIDSILELLLRNNLCGSKTHLDCLFKPNGPLSSFSSRISMAYSLGFLSKNHLHDIQIVRKIRNEFGHNPEVISFSNSKIEALCNRLVLIGKRSIAPKSKFITSIAVLTGSIETSLLEGDKDRIKERKDIDFEKIKEYAEKFVQFGLQVIKANDSLS